MATKRLKFAELKDRIDGAPWDDEELCSVILHEADSEDQDNREIVSVAERVLTALADLETILEELEIGRG